MSDLGGIKLSVHSNWQVGERKAKWATLSGNKRQLSYSVANYRCGRIKNKMADGYNHSHQGDGGRGVPTCTLAETFTTAASTIWDSVWILLRRSLSSEFWAKAWNNNQFMVSLLHQYKIWMELKSHPHVWKVIPPQKNHAVNVWIITQRRETGT